MFKKIVQGSKITFGGFLSGVPARDYMFQSAAYDNQIIQAAKMIKEAEYCLIGAGLSTAVGAQYSGKFFEENFGEFQQKYGKGQYMQDMYSESFISYLQKYVIQKMISILKKKICYYNFE